MPNPYSQYAQPYMNGSATIPHGSFANTAPQLKPGQQTLANSAGGGPGYTPGRDYSYSLSHPGMTPGGQPIPQGFPGALPPQVTLPPTPAPMPTTGQQPPMQMQPSPVPPPPLPQLPGPVMNPYARFGSGVSPYQMPMPMNPYASFSPSY